MRFCCFIAIFNVLLIIYVDGYPGFNKDTQPGTIAIPTRNAAKSYASYYVDEPVTTSENNSYEIETTDAFASEEQSKTKGELDTTSMPIKNKKEIEKKPYLEGEIPATIAPPTVTSKSYDYDTDVPITTQTNEGDELENQDAFASEEQFAAEKEPDTTTILIEKQKEFEKGTHLRKRQHREGEIPATIAPPTAASKSKYYDTDEPIATQTNEGDELENQDTFASEEQFATEKEPDTTTILIEKQKKIEKRTHLGKRQHREGEIPATIAPPTVASKSYDYDTAEPITTQTNEGDELENQDAFASKEQFATEKELDTTTILIEKQKEIEKGTQLGKRQHREDKNATTSGGRNPTEYITVHTTSTNDSPSSDTTDSAKIDYYTDDPIMRSKNESYELEDPDAYYEEEQEVATTTANFDKDEKIEAERFLRQRKHREGFRERCSFDEQIRIEDEFGCQMCTCLYEKKIMLCSPYRCPKYKLTAQLENNMYNDYVLQVQTHFSEFQCEAGTTYASPSCECACVVQNVLSCPGYCHIGRPLRG